MRLMSFAMTTAAIAAKQKTVTRRFGWWSLQPGTLVQPVVQAMGLKKGEQVTKIGGPLRVVSVRREPLNAIDAADCAREGFPELTPAQFVAMLCAHYRCAPDAEVNRIEFEYVA